jgi:type VI secretion system Hcp family effector
MPTNTFITFFDKAEGESFQKGKEKWLEIQDWEWEVEAETSWTKGGGASVGKPNPGKLSFSHHFDSASPVLLGYICSGKAFPKMQLEMMKTTSKGTPETYFTVVLEGVFLTKISNSSSEEGTVLQRVELVFKTVRMEYKPQDKMGALATPKIFTWDIPAGISSPNM